MSDEVSQAESTEKVPEQIRRPALLFIVNAHAATVNMRLYPLASSMVTDTFTKAKEALEDIFKLAEHLAVATVEQTLLVNDSRLEDVDQAKAPIKSFIAWMNERGLSNIEFREGVTGDELQTFFSTIGNVEMADRSKLSEELGSLGVEHISVNQRVYVAVTTNDSGEIIGTAQSASAPLDALKDELLMRYLTGKVDLGDIADHDLVELLSDPGKVGGLLSAFLTEEGSEGGVLMKSQKAEEALNALADLVDTIEDPTLRESMSGQITSVIAEMSPRQMTSVLTGEAPDSLNLDSIRENVIKMLSDTQLLDMIDSLISEYMEMKDEAGDLDTTWTRDRLQDLNELLLEVRGDRGSNIDQIIDERLDQAGIQEERDLHTGKRVLSAYEMLGGPLEEEDLDMLEGVDQTIPKQIRQLYAMEEIDLAAGMLLKLATNFRQDSDQVRRFAARLLKETLEGLDEQHALIATDVLRPTLVETMEGEEDYEVFRLMSESASMMTGLYMRAGRADEAGTIIAVLMEQAADDVEKGDELKKKAHEAVSTMMGPDGMINAEALLLEEDEEKRTRTIRALASMGPEALAPLVNIVKDRGAIEYREKALSALRSAGETGIDAIIGELDRDNPWYIYRNILNVIAEMRLIEGLPQVTAMVSSHDERIRREAVRSLARIGAPESLPTVLNAANDQSPAVRRTAVRVLGLFGSSSVAPFLLDLINGQGPRGREEDNGVMEAACLALGDLRDASFVPQLAELIGKGGFFKKGRPDEIRAAACLALGSIGDESAGPVLERAMKDPVVMVRSSAEKALRRLRGGITVPEPIDDDMPEVAGVSAGAVRAADFVQPLEPEMVEAAVSREPQEVPAAAEQQEFHAPPAQPWMQAPPEMEQPGQYVAQEIQPPSGQSATRAEAPAQPVAPTPVTPAPPLEQQVPAPDRQPFVPPAGPAAPPEPTTFQESISQPLPPSGRRAGPEQEAPGTRQAEPIQEAPVAQQPIYPPPPQSAPTQQQSAEQQAVEMEVPTWLQNTGSPQEPGQPPEIEPPVQQPPAIEPPVPPPAQQPPAIEPPVQQPPAIEPPLPTPAQQPPAIEPPVPPPAPETQPPAPTGPPAQSPSVQGFVEPVSQAMPDGFVLDQAPVPTESQPFAPLDRQTQPFAPLDQQEEPFVPADRQAEHQPQAPEPAQFEEPVTQAFAPEPAQFEEPVTQASAPEPVPEMPVPGPVMREPAPVQVESVQADAGGGEPEPAVADVPDEGPEPGSLESIISQWSQDGEALKPGAPGEVPADIVQAMPDQIEGLPDDEGTGHAGYGTGTLEEMLLEAPAGEPPVEELPDDGASREARGIGPSSPETMMGDEQAEGPSAGEQPASLDQPDLPERPGSEENHLPGHTLPSDTPAPPDVARMWPEGGSLNGHDHPVPPPPPLDQGELEARFKDAGEGPIAPIDPGVVGLPEDAYGAARTDQPSTIERMLGPNEKPGAGDKRPGHEPPPAPEGPPPEGQEPPPPSRWK